MELSEANLQSCTFVPPSLAFAAGLSFKPTVLPLFSYGTMKQVLNFGMMSDALSFDSEAVCACCASVGGAAVVLDVGFALLFSAGFAPTFAFGSGAALGLALGFSAGFVPTFAFGLGAALGLALALGFFAVPCSSCSAGLINGLS